MDDEYTIGELANRAGVTSRTVRYYVANGLLPGPTSAGPRARYTETHLNRLRLVRDLQREHLPLAEIHTRLEMLTDGDVASLVARGPARPPAGALEYVRSVLAGSSGPAASAATAAERAQPYARAHATFAPPGPAPMARAAAFAPAAAASDAGAATEAPASAPDMVAGYAAAPSRRGETTDYVTRSQWERVPLSANVELHIRRPLSRLENRRVERLIALAREVLREDEP